MKKRTIALIASALVVAALAGCGQKTAGNFTDEMKIPYDGITEIEGAAGVEREGDVKNSAYYVHPDYYNMKSGGTMTILSGYKTIQQTTEWTCGPAAALTVLEWYGKRDGMNEMDLVALRGKDEPGATNLQQMINIFEGLGGWDLFTTYDLDDPDYITEDFLLSNLADGNPIIIGWDDWGGHWQVVIGYDTMGTETTADDVIVLVDPYDTTDHNQDGYVTFSFERLYYNWKNTFDPDFDRNVFVVATPVS